MSDLRAAARSGFFFGGFRLFTQALSWGITIVIARMLNPEDYGLMEMALVLIAYVELFSELGLGAAIIQRKEISQKELSSIFWLSFIVSNALGVVSFALAYPTAWIFGESRIISVTQAMSVLFAVGGLMIVPFNLLMREFKFKEVGIIECVAVILSGGSMLFMAKAGWGIWTLAAGTILARCVTVALVCSVAKWRPNFYFRFADVRPLLSFGLKVAGSRSLHYIFRKLDRIIVGKMLGVESLGYYTLALTFAEAPTSKFISFITQISFPIFSRLQGDLLKFGDIYVKLTKYIAILMTPIFLGGFFFSREIIAVCLGEKWIPITSLFSMFCLSQFIYSLCSLSVVVNNAQARPQWCLYMTSILAFFMPISIYVAAHYGLDGLAVPWITVYPVIYIVFTALTIQKISLSGSRYLKGLVSPLVASSVMIAGIWVVQKIWILSGFDGGNGRKILFQEIFTGAVLYLGYLVLVERETLLGVWNLRQG